MDALREGSATHCRQSSDHRPQCVARLRFDHRAGEAAERAMSIKCVQGELHEFDGRIGALERYDDLPVERIAGQFEQVAARDAVGRGRVKLSKSRVLQNPEASRPHGDHPDAFARIIITPKRFAYSEAIEAT